MNWRKNKIKEFEMLFKLDIKKSLKRETTDQLKKIIKKSSITGKLVKREEIVDKYELILILKVPIQ